MLPKRHIINIVNFIRYDDPREPQRDLLEPVARQMELLRLSGLPCTWLLQFDALVAGPYTDFLKANLPANHEVGLWFEINRMHCEAASVPFRGKEGVNWDHHVQAAFPVGYTPAERERLADAAVSRFREMFGAVPQSVAAWYMDAHTLARLSDLHGVKAFAICREQCGTDGYTFWGGPFAGGYYPSRRNTLVPAQTAEGQISTPVFRLLGPDPIHQYDTGIGTTWQGVLTLEPVYEAAGKNPGWVRRFLDIVAQPSTPGFSYAQAGQENSFGWEAMAEGYAMQVEEFQRRRAAGELEFETLGETGQWFRQTFKETPPQTIVALQDTMEPPTPERKAIWYTSKYYRANLLIEDGQLFLRDMHVFDERYAERYLECPCDLHAARFDALPVLDGFNWSASWEERALGQWKVGTVREPEVAETSTGGLSLDFPVYGEDRLAIVFEETGWRASLKSGGPLRLSVRWAASARTAFSRIEAHGSAICFEHEGFAYTIRMEAGTAWEIPHGFELTSNAEGVIELKIDNTK
ncbi:MAG: hypothetical protein ACFUZC_20930 [Chthoniobacteraceae bacterium]